MPKKKKKEDKKTDVKGLVKAERKKTKSNKLEKGQKKKKEEKESISKTYLIEQFGPVAKDFIVEHIKVINYVDMANLLGIKLDNLKEAVEEIGIKLPFKRAYKWDDIDVGQFRSLTDCARCQVQISHRSFFVGIKNCQKCYEKNIKYWIEKKITINVEF